MITPEDIGRIERAAEAASDIKRGHICLVVVFDINTADIHITARAHESAAVVRLAQVVSTMLTEGEAIPVVMPRDQQSRHKA